MSATGAAAQQFVTDDAAIVDPGACQLEAWYARPASWVLPACQFIINLELTAGIGAVETTAGVHEARYVIQAKTLLRPLAPNDFGLGLVAGFGLDPLGQIVARRIDTVYAYVPLSISLLDDALILHQNIGWLYGSDLTGDAVGTRQHAVSWGMRADGALTGRVAAIAELFGQSRAFPEYQLGLRFTLVPDRLLMDTSYSGGTAPGGAGAVAVGLAWTPAPLR